MFKYKCEWEVGTYISRKLGLHLAIFIIQYGCAICKCNLKRYQPDILLDSWQYLTYLHTYICDGTAQFCLFLCRIITFQLLVRTMNFHMAAWAHCKYMRATVVFCYQNCSDLLWEKSVLVIGKKNLIRGKRPRICKNFEITRTIY